jgi:hypothetical protein
VLLHEPPFPVNIKEAIPIIIPFYMPDNSHV